MQRKSVFALAIALLLLTIVFIPAFSITAVPPPSSPTISQLPDSPEIDGALATAVLYPNHDAPVRQGAPAATAPNESDLGAGYDNGFLYGSTGLVRSYLRFNLSGIAADSVIVSATLHLKQSAGQDYPATARTITFYRVTGSWDESSITWNNRPAYANAVGSVSTTYNYLNWVSFDVTDQVRSWVSGSQPNYGLVAVGPETIPGVVRAFVASGYVGQPELHVRYLPAPPPVLDAWPGNLSMRASGTAVESLPTLNVGNVTRGTLAWTAGKVGAAPWLTLNQTSGSATPTTPGTVSFSVNTAGLTPGTYTEQIQVSSSTAGVENSPIVTTFTLEVLNALYPVYLPAIMGGSGSGSNPAPNIVAVVVGIADYENLGPAPSSGNLPDAWGYDLYAPIYDVADFVAWLQTHLNVQAENIIQLTENNATRSNMFNSFGIANDKLTAASANFPNAIQQADNDSIFIFYYSGHGAQNPDTNGDEGDGYDEFIAAYDTNLNEGTGVFSPVISDDDLDGLLATISAGRIVVILDSCFSGSMMSTTALGEKSQDTIHRGLISPLAPNTPVTVDALSELTGKNRLIITAGTGNQLTWESYSLQNGVFTHFFLQGLADSLNDVNGNGRISAEEAYWFSRDTVDDWVFNNTGEHQNPAINDQIFGQVDLTPLP